MSSLLDKMFLKRFCLPYDTNISAYESGKCNVSSCLCGHYNHVSCVLQGKLEFNNIKILSFGFNQMGDTNGNTPGIHAEYDALTKLSPIKNKKRLEIINLFVIRLSTKNKIQSSKPCSNCIDAMKIYPMKIGYKIKHIYYSDYQGNIVKTTLNDLDVEEKHYSKYFRRKQKPQNS